MPQISIQNLSLTEKERLHKDFVENEKIYWELREEFLKQYWGKWVAIHAGEIVATGDDLLDVTDDVGELGCHAYIALVGQEDDLVFTVRRKEFNYDVAYRPFALPRAEVAFSNYQGTGRGFYPDVIPDTGADLSVLPEDDCSAIGLFQSPYLVGRSRGVLGPSATALVYRGNAEINGTFYRCLIQPISQGKERILGRDVLNQAKVTFDGPQNKVVFE
jgi:hypothetical protein